MPEHPAAPTGSPPPDLPTPKDTKGIRYDFNDGARVLLPQGKWRVQLTDEESGNIVFACDSDGGWVVSSKKYYVPFNVKVWERGQTTPLLDHTLDLTGKSVLIKFPVGTLGDLVGWVPYAAKFARKYRPRLECALGREIADVFAAQYPGVTFSVPQEVKTKSPYASYRVGLFFGGNHDCQPIDFRAVGLHRTAGYILSVDPAEEIPLLNLSAPVNYGGEHSGGAIRSAGAGLFQYFLNAFFQVFQFFQFLGAARFRLFLFSIFLLLFGFFLFGFLLLLFWRPLFFCFIFSRLRRSRRRSVYRLGLQHALMNIQYPLAVRYVRARPTAVKILPSNAGAEDMRQVFYYFVARVDDWRFRRFFAGIGQQVLYVRPHSHGGSGEGSAFRAAAYAAQTAKIILRGFHVAAVTEKTGFQKSLAESDVRPDVFISGFFIIKAHEFFRRAVKFSAGIGFFNKIDRLFFGGEGRPGNGQTGVFFGRLFGARRGRQTGDGGGHKQKGDYFFQVRFLRD